jgi:hypothetical protein
MYRHPFDKESLTGDRIRAAREVLETHDALRAATNNEPQLDEDGLPLDPAAWAHWHEAVYKPAYQRWDRAINKLGTMVYVLSRHPSNFRPICNSILASDNNEV